MSIALDDDDEALSIVLIGILLTVNVVVKVCTERSFPGWPWRSNLLTKCKTVTYYKIVLSDILVIVLHSALRSSLTKRCIRISYSKFQRLLDKLSVTHGLLGFSEWIFEAIRPSLCVIADSRRCMVWLVNDNALSARWIAKPDYSSVPYFSHWTSWNSGNTIQKVRKI